MIIGLSGVAQSGKSTGGIYLQDHYRVAIWNFADPIKEICRRVFDFSEEQLYGDTKEIVDKRYNISAREAMQKLGTEWGRALYDDVWVELLLREIEVAQEAWHLSYVYNIICDVRFPNEVEAIQQAGGKVIRLARGEDAVRRAVERRSVFHRSETALLDYVGFDVELDNTGTLEEYYDLLDEVPMSWERKKK